MRFAGLSGLSLLVLGLALPPALANGLRPPNGGFNGNFNGNFNGGLNPGFNLPQPMLRVGANEFKLVVVIDEKAKQPRLEVPRVMLLGPVPAPAPARPKGRLGDAGGTPSVMVGLALALAFTSGGLWLSKRGRNVALVLGALSLMGLGGAVYANARVPPPPNPPKEQRVALPAGVTLPEKITMQIVDNGDAIRLVINKAALVNPPRAKE